MPIPCRRSYERFRVVANATESRREFRACSPTPRTGLFASGAILAFLVIVLLAGTAPAAVQEAGSPDEETRQRLRDAQRLVLGQSFEEAAELLREITSSHPDLPQGWMLLARALNGLGDKEGALEASLRAVPFESTASQAMFDAGTLYAALGDPDAAFAWLVRARESGFDTTRVGIDPDAAPLEEDPRWAWLFPTGEEFADPFVEDYRILEEWRGEAKNGSFGWIARNVGDVDGDGIADVTTSAPDLSERAGRVYVYSSGTGELLWTRDGEPGDRLGIGIEAAGDVDADGVPDVIAGAPGAGEAHVFSGVDGTTLLTFREEGEGDVFGRKVGDVGDVDGDGHDDVLVGAPGHDEAGEDAGAAYVYSGRDGSVLLKLTGHEPGEGFGGSGAGHADGEHTFLVVGAGNHGPEDRGRVYVYRGLSDEPAFTIDADETGVDLGAMFVSVVGDVDADGVPDVYGSDWSNNARGPSTGRVYVHSGADGRRLLTLTGEAAGDGFGIGPADAGDVDGDGHDDLIIGAWQHGSAAPSGGKTYLYSGRDGSLLAEWTCKVMGDTFGFDATGMGDVDGDGVIDFLLTSAWSAVNGARSGRMFILAGKLER